MNHHVVNPRYTSSQDYEAQLIKRYHQQEMRRLLQRPSTRARLAGVLRHLAERVDQHTAPLHQELTIAGTVPLHLLQAGDELCESQRCLKCA